MFVKTVLGMYSSRMKESSENQISSIKKHHIAVLFLVGVVESIFQKQSHF
jgi:hypothetical protein